LPEKARGRPSPAAGKGGGRGCPEIERGGGEALRIEADATDAGGTTVVDQVVGRFGRLDVAFNNAGTARTFQLADWMRERGTA
jgi:NAD(P)-dependent dehydrogenase (short-subunit alcohol dehydrogenase family)